VNVVLLGLSITSSWGNGHATNFRALVTELVRRGHRVLFAEREQPWYAAHRDLTEIPGARILLYRDLAQLRAEAGGAVAEADLVLEGSYVPEGSAVADWLLRSTGGVTAFYDIDTPITVDALARGEREHLAPEQIARFDLYLSFTGGPILDTLRERFGARRPLWFPCLVDPDRYRPLGGPADVLLGYLGTHSDDRLAGLQRLLLDVAAARPAERFVLAGSSYPDELRVPANVERIDHLAPGDHGRFYNRQRFTLNLTRAKMREHGWSPSVRLFEAAACGTPIISDRWPGLEEVFVPGEEILLASGTEEVLAHLALDAPRRAAIAARARETVLAGHTAGSRVQMLEREVAAHARQGSAA
jgi:spore maturation protein CgeB